MPSYYMGPALGRYGYYNRRGYGWNQGGGDPLEGLNSYQGWQNSPGYKALLESITKGGTSAGVMERYGQPSYQFYQEQMRSKDPMGTLANLEGYARNRYGSAARGIHEQFNAAQRQYQESTGGLRAGGVNPNMDAYMKAFMGAQKAGATGNVWTELQNAEQALRQQALESTAVYRKGAADAASDWARSVSGATASDEQLRMAGAGQLAGMELQGSSAYANLLMQLLAPLLQGYGRHGTVPDLGKDKIQELFRMLGVA